MATVIQALPWSFRMAKDYAAVVRAVVAEADQTAAAGLKERMNRGAALAQLLARNAGFQYKAKSVQSWMRGDTMPPGNVLLAIAHSAGISLDARLEINREPTEAERQVARLAEIERQLDSLSAVFDRQWQRLDSIEERLHLALTRRLEELEVEVRAASASLAQIISSLDQAGLWPSVEHWREAEEGKGEVEGGRRH